MSAGSAIPCEGVSTASILTWNVLADAYVTKGGFPLCPNASLIFSSRSPALIGEIRRRDPDIVTLQEVDRFAEFWADKLVEAGYDVFYVRRGGCMISYRCSDPDRSARYDMLLAASTSVSVLGPAVQAAATVSAAKAAMKQRMENPKVSKAQKSKLGKCERTYERNKLKKIIRTADLLTPGSPHTQRFIDSRLAKGLKQSAADIQLEAVHKTAQEAVKRLSAMDEEDRRAAAGSVVEKTGADQFSDIPENVDSQQGPSSTVAHTLTPDNVQTRDLRLRVSDKRSDCSSCQDEPASAPVSSAAPIPASTSTSLFPTNSSSSAQPRAHPTSIVQRRDGCLVAFKPSKFALAGVPLAIDADDLAFPFAPISSGTTLSESSSSLSIIPSTAAQAMGLPPEPAASAEDGASDIMEAIGSKGGSASNGISRFFKNNVAIALPLVPINASSEVCGKPFVLATAYLFWNPACEDVKLWQTMYFTRAVESLRVATARSWGSAAGALPASSVPVIFTGDFNSVPSSQVYCLLTGGVTSGSSNSEGRSAGPFLRSVDVVACDESMKGRINLTADDVPAAVDPTESSEPDAKEDMFSTLLLPPAETPFSPAAPKLLVLSSSLQLTRTLRSFGFDTVHMTPPHASAFAHPPSGPRGSDGVPGSNGAENEGERFGEEEDADDAPEPASDADAPTNADRHGADEKVPKNFATGPVSARARLQACFVRARTDGRIILTNRKDIIARADCPRALLIPNSAPAAFAAAAETAWAELQVQLRAERVGDDEGQQQQQQDESAEEAPVPSKSRTFNSNSSVTKPPRAFVVMAYALSRLAVSSSAPTEGAGLRCRRCNTPLVRTDPNSSRARMSPAVSAAVATASTEAATLKGQGLEFYTCPRKSDEGEVVWFGVGVVSRRARQLQALMAGADTVQILPEQQRLEPVAPPCPSADPETLVVEDKAPEGENETEAASSSGIPRVLVLSGSSERARTLRSVGIDVAYAVPPKMTGNARNSINSSHNIDGVDDPGVIRTRSRPMIPAADVALAFRKLFDEARRENRILVTDRRDILARSGCPRGIFVPPAPPELFASAGCAAVAEAVAAAPPTSFISRLRVPVPRRDLEAAYLLAALGAPYDTPERAGLLCKGCGVRMSPLPRGDGGEDDANAERGPGGELLDYYLCKHCPEGESEPLPLEQGAPARRSVLMKLIIDGARAAGVVDYDGAPPLGDSSATLVDSNAAALASIGEEPSPSPQPSPLSTLSTASQVGSPVGPDPLSALPPACAAAVTADGVILHPVLPPTVKGGPFLPPSFAYLTRIPTRDNALEAAIAALPPLLVPVTGTLTTDDFGSGLPPLPPASTRGSRRSSLQRSQPSRRLPALPEQLWAVDTRALLPVLHLPLPASSAALGDGLERSGWQGDAFKRVWACATDRSEGGKWDTLSHSLRLASVFAPPGHIPVQQPVHAPAVAAKRPPLPEDVALAPRTDTDIILAARDKQGAGEPEYTNFTDKFRECLDYVFVSYGSLKCIERSTRAMETDESLPKPPFPSAVFPSDHTIVTATVDFS